MISPILARTCTRDNNGDGLEHWMPRHRVGRRRPATRFTGPTGESCSGTPPSNCMSPRCRVSSGAGREFGHALRVSSARQSPCQLGLRTYNLIMRADSDVFSLKCMVYIGIYQVFLVVFNTARYTLPAHCTPELHIRIDLDCRQARAGEPPWLYIYYRPAGARLEVSDFSRGFTRTQPAHILRAYEPHRRRARPAPQATLAWPRL